MSDVACLHHGGERRYWRCVVCGAEGEDDGTARAMGDVDGKLKHGFRAEAAEITHWLDGRCAVVCSDGKHEDDVALSAMRLQRSVGAISGRAVS